MRHDQPGGRSRPTTRRVSPWNAQLVLWSAAVLLLALVGWSVRLAVQVAELRAELETRVGWLVTIERLRTEPDTSAVGLVESLSGSRSEAVDAIMAYVDRRDAATAHQAVLAVRSETRGLSLKLGDYWDALNLLVAALAALAIVTWVLLVLRATRARRLTAALDETAAAREQLVERAAALARSNAALDEFASAVSHDLRTPLQTIRGYAGLVRTHHAARLPGQARDQLELVEHAAARLAEMIDALLAYARLDGRPEGPTDAGDALDEALSNLRASLDARNAEVVAAPLPTVSMARGNLVRVFQNLVDNAVKYSGEEAPVVRVEAEADGGRWRFRVSDRGIGIPREEHERIFDVFGRGDGASELPGTGVGLATVKKLVEHCGGTIRVESEPGLGSTFVFTLPGGSAAAER